MPITTTVSASSMRIRALGCRPTFRTTTDKLKGEDRCISATSTIYLEIVLVGIVTQSFTEHCTPAKAAAFDCQNIFLADAGRWNVNGMLLPECENATKDVKRQRSHIYFCEQNLNFVFVYFE